jgi:hypothetical protein
MMKLMTDLYTGPDGKTWDWVRITCGFGAAIGFGLQLYTVLVRGEKFDFTQFGIGVGAIIAAGAGGMWARKDVELAPKHNEGKDE